MSPPSITIEEPLQEGDDISANVSIGRLPSQVGELTVQVSARGPCDACITRTTSFVLPSSQTNYTFPFSVSAGNLTEGSYTQYLDFLLYQELEPGSGSASASVQHGISFAIRFSVAAGVNADASEAEPRSGGGGRVGELAEDEDSAQEDETSIVEEDEGGDATSGGDVVQDADGLVIENGTEEVGTLEPASPEFYRNTESSLGGAQVVSLSPEVLSIDHGATEPIEAYALSVETATCGASHGEIQSFTDLITRYISGNLLGERAISVASPVLPGSALAKDNIALSLVLEDLVLGSDVQITRAKHFAHERLMTFYVLVDTGPTGILASQACIAFNPEIMKFVGVDTAGSIFSYTDYIGDSGTIHFRGITERAFIGTHGYVAALHFLPMKEGVASLMFQHVTMFQPEGNTGTTLALRDIEGVFIRYVQGQSSFVAAFQVILMLIACCASMGAVYFLKK